MPKKKSDQKLNKKGESTAVAQAGEFALQDKYLQDLKKRVDQEREKENRKTAWYA